MRSLAHEVTESYRATTLVDASTTQSEQDLVQILVLPVYGVSKNHCVVIQFDVSHNGLSVA